MSPEEWEAAKEAGPDIVVNATMKPVGAGPAEVNVTFSFNDSDQINKVNLENIVKTQLIETDVLPDFISSRIAVDNCMIGTPEIAELSRGAENGEDRLREQRAKIHHRTDADEDKQWEEFGVDAEFDQDVQQALRLIHR